MTEQCGIDLFSSSGFGQKKSSKRKLPLGDSSNQKDIRSFVVGGGGAKQDGKGKRPAKGPSMAKGKSSSGGGTSGSLSVFSFLHRARTNCFPQANRRLVVHRETAPPSLAAVATIAASGAAAAWATSLALGAPASEGLALPQKLKVR